MNDSGVDTTVADHVREELVRFVRALRRAGASVPANAAVTGAQALAEVGLDRRTRAQTALRAGLLSDSEDFGTFDRLFETFWRRLTAGSDAERSMDDTEEPDGSPAPFDDPSDHEESTDRGDDGDDADPDPGTGQSLVESFAAAAAGTDNDKQTTTALYSPSGTASAVDGRLPPDSGELASTFPELTKVLDGLPGRRFTAGSDRADVRRALRSSVSTGGTVLSVPKRERHRSAVRALFVVDVSRSVLDAVDRGFLLDFLRRAARDWRDVRVFFFDEDLRETTDAVDASSASAAMAALDAAETAWGGGTRIGDSLTRLHETAPEAVDRRTIVFVISDGLEMGDVSALERELSWLSRRSKRILWLNPLATAESYEPTARGMAAALPYLDGLFAFADPSDVAELARQLKRSGPGGRIGYEFDTRISAGTHHH